VTKIPKPEMPRAEGRGLAIVPIRFLAALIVIAVIAVAFGLAAHGFHQMNMAGPSVSWAHM
jgi:hypothetical protein